MWPVRQCSVIVHFLQCDNGIGIWRSALPFSGDAAGVVEVLWCVEWFTLEQFSQTRARAHTRTHTCARVHIN